MNFLVTGGAGYVGSFASRRLLAAGHGVEVVDNLSEGHRDAIPAAALHVGEIADRDLVSGLMRDRKVDAVIHFAGSTYVGVSVEDPRSYYRNNVAGTLALLESMVDSGVGVIVFSSSCSTYGEQAEMPLHEQVSQQPSSPYAFTKFVCERMIRDFAHAYGLRFVLLRYFNASGGSEDGSHGEDHRPETHLIPLVLQTLLGQREKLQVFGSDYSTPDGTCVRDYIHVEDLAEIHELSALWAAEAAEGCGEAFNAGTGTGHSVMEVIATAERVTGKTMAFEVGKRRSGDAATLVASSDKALRELGWTPRFQRFDDLVASAWEWHSRHPQGYAR